MYPCRRSHRTNRIAIVASTLSLVLTVLIIPGAMSFSSINRIRPSRWALKVLSSPNQSSQPSKSVKKYNIAKNKFSTKTNTNANNDTNNNIIRPLVVCGPSGVGKGTIIEKYCNEHGGSQKFGFTVSHTTRSPRPGEEDGIHYHFTDVPSIKAAIQQNLFLEFAEVHGNWYGTSLESLSHVQDKEGKLPLLDIDVQGVKNIKAWQKNQDLGENPPELGLPSLDAKFIFIAPPSLDILKERLMGRGTETAESLEKRTNNAIAEVEYGMMEGNFDAVVVNDDLDQACLDFGKAIENIYGDDL